MEHLNPAVKTGLLREIISAGWQTETELHKAASLTAISVICVNDDCPHVEEITF